MCLHQSNTWCLSRIVQVHDPSTALSGVDDPNIWTSVCVDRRDAMVGPQCRGHLTFCVSGPVKLPTQWLAECVRDPAPATVSALRWLCLPRDSGHLSLLLVCNRKSGPGPGPTNFFTVPKIYSLEGRHYLQFFFWLLSFFATDPEGVSN